MPKLVVRNIFLMVLTLAMIIFCYGNLAQNTRASNAMTVWTASSLSRISQESKFPQESDRISDKHISLQAGRGEYESFQIVVQASDNQYLENVNLFVEDLRSIDGGVIKQQNIDLYREHYIYVDRPTPKKLSGNATEGKGWYADALIPFDDSITGIDLQGEIDAVPFDLAMGRQQPIWVDIYVPRDTPKGIYHGQYTVDSRQGISQGDISLRVWDFELPVKPTIHSYFNSWRDRGDNLTQELLKHKIMSGKWIQIDQQKELIEDFGLSSVRLPFWSGANYNTCKMSPAPSVAEIKEAAALYDESLLKFIYSADEIDRCTDIEGSLKQWSHNIHKAGVKNLVVTRPRPELYEDIDIWVVQPKMYPSAEPEIAEVMQRGDEVWFYGGYHTGYSPQWQIDAPPINLRIPQGLIAQSLGLTGILYPQIDAWNEDESRLPLWTNDPWHVPSVYQQGKRDFSGEGMLIYPGQEVGLEGIVPSIRLKRIRDGIEDYEYIAILKRLGDEEWALATSRTAAKNWQNWTKDPQVLEDVRIKLAERIQQLTKKQN